MSFYCKKIFAAFLLVGLIFTAPLADKTSAQSLWGDSASSNVFSDRKARNVGDILTIIINESTTQSMNKSSSNSKSGSLNLNTGVGIFDFLRLASAGGNDEFKADGSTSSTNRVNAQVTVTVTEVKPNGNMIIEGAQSIWQGRNEHRILLRGVVRRDDVTAMNTIPSTKVADATLKFDGKGPINAKQRQGILTQIFNILF